MSSLPTSLAHAVLISPFHLGQNWKAPLQFLFNALHQILRNDQMVFSILDDCIGQVCVHSNRSISRHGPRRRRPHRHPQAIFTKVHRRLHFSTIENRIINPSRFLLSGFPSFSPPALRICSFAELSAFKTENAA